MREPSVTEVRDELQAVLASRAFRQSRGLARLLRYICSRGLLDEAGPITEYTIAVDVLGKTKDFKESKDASVRVEVHRLRKRLAEYYEQEGAGHSIRIVIPTGQYTPQFLVCDPGRNDSEPAAVNEGDCVADPPPAVVEIEPQPAAPSEFNAPVSPGISAPVPLRRALPKRLWIAAAILATLALALAAILWRPTEPLDSFWRPVLSSPNPILLCFGNVAGGRRSPAGAETIEGLTLLEYHGLPSQMMLVPDAITLSRFAGLLQSKGKRYRLASQSEINFSDLRYAPAVLIGLANNDWTERLVGKLRFTVEHRQPRKLLLRDSTNPSREDWLIDYAVPYLSLTRDYALVVRVLDPRTEQMVVTAAGLSVFGTLAAGEFLTDPDQFRRIQAVAPKDWQQKNFELVLSADVIRGKSGHPNIVASHFW